MPLDNPFEHLTRLQGRGAVTTKLEVQYGNFH